MLKFLVIRRKYSTITTIVKDCLLQVFTSSLSTIGASLHDPDRIEIGVIFTATRIEMKDKNGLQQTVLFRHFLMLDRHNFGSVSLACDIQLQAIYIFENIFVTCLHSVRHIKKF